MKSPETSLYEGSTFLNKVHLVLYCTYVGNSSNGRLSLLSFHGSLVLLTTFFLFKICFHSVSIVPGPYLLEVCVVFFRFVSFLEVQ